MHDYGYAPSSGGILFYSTGHMERQRRVIRQCAGLGRMDRLTRYQRVCCRLYVGSETRYPVCFAAIGRVLGVNPRACRAAIERAIDRMVR